MQMLLGLVRVVPDHLLFKAACGFVVFDPDHVGANDPLERMQHGAGAKPLFGAGPCRSVAQTHGIVIAVSETESKQQSSRCLESERVDELFAEQPHGCRAQDDDALFVQPDNALIGTKIQELREMERLDRRAERSEAVASWCCPFYDSDLVAPDTTGPF